MARAIEVVAPAAAAAAVIVVVAAAAAEKIDIYETDEDFLLTVAVYSYCKDR